MIYWKTELIGCSCNRLEGTFNVSLYEHSYSQFSTECNLEEHLCVVNPPELSEASGYYK